MWGQWIELKRENFYLFLSPVDERFGELSDEISLAVADRSEFASLVQRFDHVTGQEWFQSWDALDSILRDFLPQLVAVLDKTDPMLHRCISAAVKFARRFAVLFGGAGLVKNKIRPAFASSLAIPKEVAGKKKSKIKKLRSAGTDWIYFNFLVDFRTKCDKYNPPPPFPHPSLIKSFFIKIYFVLFLLLTLLKSFLRFFLNFVVKLKIFSVFRSKLEIRSKKMFFWLQFELFFCLLWNGTFKELKESFLFFKESTKNLFFS